MDSRSRALGKLRLRATNLAQLAAKQNFGATIDEKQFALENATTETDALRDRVADAALAEKHANKLKEIYERVTQQVEKLAGKKAVNPEKVVELLQAELNQVETQNGQNKQM